MGSQHQSPVAEEKPSGFKKANPSRQTRQNLGTVLSPREKKKVPVSTGPWKAPAADAEHEERHRQHPAPARLVRQERVLTMTKIVQSSSIARSQDPGVRQGLANPPVALHTPTNVDDPSSTHVVNSFATLTLIPDDAGSATASEDDQRNEN
ncbi:hypothetical protein [Variovorax sp. DT-64]|uniref:hypothetical protein n=1 Tax=Variovorax sp. DT-64 TaxID=3396160 RepID=UPI003F1D21A1